MEKKFINILTVSLFVIIFCIITYQNSLVLEYSLLQIRSLDDLALLNSIVRLKNFIYERNLQYTFGFIDYSYGNLFWILNTIVLVPLTIFNNDGIVIFAAREITAIFAFGCLYLIIRISQILGACKTTANIIGLFFILTPNFFLWSMKFHVNYYSVFFGLLSLLIILNSKVNILKNIIYSSIFFGVSVGFKLTGILLYPFLIFILIYRHSFLKIYDRIYLLFVFNIIFFFSFIISFSPALFFSLFYLEEAKKIFKWIIIFKNMGNSTVYLDPTVLFIESIKFYYEIIIFLILLLFGVWWSLKEYFRYKNIIPLFLLINILVGFLLVTFYFNKPPVYIASYTMIISSLLPILLCGIKFFTKEITKFLVLYLLLILQVFLNFDFLKTESIRHYKLTKSEEYINSKKILKDVELIIDQNLLKKNNRILIDFNAFFPNGLNLQRYVTINYLSYTSNLEVIKKNNIDYAYIVLNKNNEDLKFDGHENEIKNRELLSTTGFFRENQEYTLIYNNFNIKLYEKSKF